MDKGDGFKLFEPVQQQSKVVEGLTLTLRAYFWMDVLQYAML
jgi:hypothetical protein